MTSWDVWLEGYAATGEHGTAQCLQREVVADTFPEACRLALGNKGWDMSYYTASNNTYWGCHFFDNGEDARKSFG